MGRIAFAVAVALAAAAARAEDGAALYRQKCAACHGASAEGAKMHPGPIAGRSAAEVKKIITEGRGRMKPVKGMSEDQADAIAKHVQSLKP